MSQIKRILVPTDFSIQSDVALRYAIDLAYRYGATIHLLHVLDDPHFTTVYPDAYFTDLSTLRQEMTVAANNGLTDAVDLCTARTVRATTQVASGDAARTITDEALALGTDLIVMGTHGRSGIAHMFLGSVAERVVRTAPCPVLTVRDTQRVAEALAADALHVRRLEPVDEVC